MTTQSQLSEPTPAQPELPPARETWAKLLVGIALFMAALFVAVQFGAEHENTTRFGFPDKVDGIRLAQPDRAPEARGRDLYTRYNSGSDDLYSLVVEWLPETAVTDAVGDATQPTWSGDVGCAPTADGAVCFHVFEDGVVRVSQKGADVNEVADRTHSFLDGIKIPD